MKTRKMLRPGQPGTKKLVEKYGEDLFCVRYRYDSRHKRKMKTIELIVAEGPWETNTRKIPVNKIVHLRIDFNEAYIRRLVKAAGGRWNHGKKLWELPYGDVLELGLKDRMI